MDVALGTLVFLAFLVVAIVGPALAMLLGWRPEARNGDNLP